MRDDTKHKIKTIINKIVKCIISCWVRKNKQTNVLREFMFAEHFTLI